jgi:hypothetical protein
MKTKNSPRFMASLLIPLLVAGCSDIDKGVVTGKEHRNSWTQTTMIYTGKAMVPNIIHHPERWTLNISDSGAEGYCDVSKERFDSTAIGDWVECN